MKKKYLLLGLVAMFFAWSCESGKKSDDVTEAVEDAIEDVIEDVEDALDDMADDLEELSEEAVEQYDSFKRELEEIVEVSKTAPENTFVDDEGRTVYTIAPQMPSYAGGEQEMFKYLRRNVRYPRVARDQGIEGTSIVRFIVAENGEVDHVEIAKSAGNELLDAEALRVVSNMPAWTPGEQDGSAVPVQYNLPIRFQLGN